MLLVPVCALMSFLVPAAKTLDFFPVLSFPNHPRDSISDDFVAKYLSSEMFAQQTGTKGLFSFLYNITWHFVKMHVS